MIEDGNEDEILSYLKKNISKYAGKVQNIVLGCTHYPLIQNQIKQVLGDVDFFNGAPNLAKHLKDILQTKGLINTSNHAGKINFIDSSNLECKKKRFFNYLEIS